VSERQLVARRVPEATSGGERPRRWRGGERPVACDLRFRWFHRCGMRLTARMSWRAFLARI